MDGSQRDVGNPDLFYRLKLKLWNRWAKSAWRWVKARVPRLTVDVDACRRDPTTNKIRSRHDEDSKKDESDSFWSVGTRVVITEERDFAVGRCGRIIEARSVP